MITDCQMDINTDYCQLSALPKLSQVTPLSSRLSAKVGPNHFVSREPRGVKLSKNTKHRLCLTSPAPGYLSTAPGLSV